MGTVKKSITEDLRKIVGDRVTTSEFERWFYRTDIMHIPGIVRSMMKTFPDAVVKPSSIEQVAGVVAYCTKRGIPVVPRGGGTSGLFGAVPKKGGVLLDTMAMNTVYEMDTEGETITAQAGITWWELERRLRKRGLCLMSYPSSARSATLGGWIMTSGMGIGSLQYGAVLDHIFMSEMLFGNGSIKEFKAGTGGNEFFETEGILGILTRAKLQVRQLPIAESHHLLYFQNMKSLFSTILLVARHEPVPYNLEFFDHKYMALLRAAGYEVPDFAEGSGLLLASYDGAGEQTRTAEQHLKEIGKEHGGKELPGAKEHWHQRFDMLRVRRAVPELVPSSVYIPLEHLEHFYEGLKNISKRTLALVGYIVSTNQCNLMPLIATEERHSIKFMLSLSTPREIANLALAHRGKPGGGIGVWNAPYRDEILGKQRVSETKILKKQLDQEKTLNPKMWLDPPLMFTPTVYHPLMSMISKVDKVIPGAKVNRVPSGFVAELEACVQCGYCMNYCPTRLEYVSSTPRGRILITRELFLQKTQTNKETANDYLNRIYECTMCGRCGTDCSVDIKSRMMWLGVRRHLAKNGLVPGKLEQIVKIIGEHHNIAARPNEQRGNWLSRLKLPYDLKNKKTARVVYFVGCVASFFPMVQPSARAFAQLLDAAGEDFTVASGEEWCCGFPLLAAGETDVARATIRHNIELMQGTGARTIVTTCPGCYKVWKEEYEEVLGKKHNFEVFHAVEYIARLIERKRLTFRGLEMNVTYHDPCDLGRNAGLYDEPRYILQSIPSLNLVEMENNREYSTCCGSGGDLLAYNQEMALAIAGRKVSEILETGAQAAITACPSCIRAIHMAKTAQKIKFDVMDIAEVAWKAIGK